MCLVRRSKISKHILNSETPLSFSTNVIVFSYGPAFAGTQKFLLCLQEEPANGLCPVAVVSHILLPDLFF